MKVLVAMSGGVDSSVAALLLKKAGFDVIGASMHLYSCNRSAGRTCCSAKDRLDAAKVCEVLGIPFLSLDYRNLFREKVVEPFVDEYLEGRTPSPCILCNTHLKFAVLLNEAQKIGAQAVATGHYARIGRENCRYSLLRGIDAKKDQSYFLFTLTQEDLSRTRFPVGSLTKEEVRKIAKENGLPTSDKSESQEICFVPDNDYAAFVESSRPGGIGGPGDFVGVDGKVIGRHKGIHNYTIGQRRGLGFGTGARQYVVNIDAAGNRVVLGSSGDLLRKEMRVNAVNLIGGETLENKVDVQIRSTHKAAPAKIEILNDDEVKVVFDNEQKAVAPGQAAVFYRGDKVLGGGWID